jgi:hypothetical protein
MEVVAAILMIVVCAVAIARAERFRTKLGAGQQRALQAGRLQHRRSGDYPSSCSWCRNTALARKLFVFERVSGEWRSRDLIGRLKVCADAEVEMLAAALVGEQPMWRRFCTERCTNEFLTAERVQAVEAFGGCDYCSVRFPMALVNCPNCGAARVMS